MAKLKDRAVWRLEFAHGASQNVFQFVLRIALFRTRAPIHKFAGSNGAIVIRRIVYRDFIPASFAHFHQRLVDGDTRQPRIKTRVSSKLWQVPESLHERVLDNVFRVFRTRDGSSQTKDSSLVSIN